MKAIKHVKEYYTKKLFESSTPGTTSIPLEQVGVYYVEIYGGGGGAGGNAYNSSGWIGGGGSGAGFSGYFIIDTPITCSVVVGSAGTNQIIYNTANRSGTAGSASSISDLIICTGGGAGRSQWSNCYPGSGGTLQILQPNKIFKQFNGCDGQVGGSSGGAYGAWSPCNGGYSVQDYTHYGYGAGGWHDGGNPINGYVLIEEPSTKTNADRTLSLKNYQFLLGDWVIY